MGGGIARDSGRVLYMVRAAGPEGLTVEAIARETRHGVKKLRPLLEAMVEVGLLRSRWIGPSIRAYVAGPPQPPGVMVRLGDAYERRTSGMAPHLADRTPERGL